jgi:hypothetical protein
LDFSCIIPGDNQSIEYCSYFCQRDSLSGLKENVIVGKNIPAGTGLRHFNKLEVESIDEYNVNPTVWVLIIGLD